MAYMNVVQIHYVIGGQGNPIVLAPRFAGYMYEWRHVMPSLAKNYTVMYLIEEDLGISKPVTGYDGKTTAEDIYQLVSQLGFEKIFLVAHDVGSQTAIHMGAAHPSTM